MAVKEIDKQINETVHEESKFTKQELLHSKAFANRRDALDCVIGDDETLTIIQARDRLEKFMKGKVK